MSVYVHTHTSLLFNIVYLYSGIHVFIHSFIKINSEDVFEVSMYAKQKADGFFLSLFYINRVESLHI